MPRPLILGLAFLAAMPPGFAGDWPQFRGELGTGHSSAKGIPTTFGLTENLAWKTELPGAGTSAPIIVGDQIFVTTYSGFGVPGEEGSMDKLQRHLVCLNRADGKLRWKKDFPAKLPEQERIREGHGYASSTPVADAEHVYCFFGKSGVMAFTRDGQPVWTADVGEKLNGWGSAASPVLFGDLLLINASVESESLVALNKKTGKEVWRTGGIREAWNTPILVSLPGGKTELVVAIIGKILGFNPATGEKLWSCDTDISWYMAPSLTAHEGIVYVVGGRSNQSLAVKAGGTGDVTRSHRIWTARKGSNVPSPIYHDGHVYWMNETLNTANCVEAATGKLVYEQRVEGRVDQVYASPILVEGKIINVCRDGRVLVIAAKPSYELLATNDLRDRSRFNATPAAVDGKLYIRSDKYLYCIGK